MVNNGFLRTLRQATFIFSFATLSFLVFSPQTAVSADDVPENVPVYFNNPVVAVVEGKTIHLNDLRDAQIHEMMMQVYQLQRHKLVEKTIQILSEQHPEMDLGEIRPVTRDDVVDFYRSTAEVKSMGTLEQMEGNIRQYLKGLNREKYLKNVEGQFKEAVSRGIVKNFFLPPTDFRLVASLGTAMHWFPKETEEHRKVFLLEYSDFQCPFCKRVQPTLDKLRKKYAGNVQFGYRHFPLPFHKEATRLAEAVECARDQDRFWEFQSLVYQNSKVAHDPDGVFDLARKSGIKNLKAFEECWSMGKYRKRVQDDVQAGAKIGIRGTPTFIIGQYDHRQGTVSGEMFSGAVPEDKFISVIEKYLTK